MISIIVTTWNRAQQLKRGLFTLINQDLPDLTQIIVVDDGSEDETRKVVEEFQIAFPTLFRYIYLNHPEPRISCYPRNVGIKAAANDIIIFTEPEGLHVGNTIKQLLEAMDRFPNNTILASQVWTMGEKIYKDLDEFYFKTPKEILQHPYAMIAADSNLGNTKAPDSDWAVTGELNCNAGVLFATHKEWLMKVGGFNEEFEGHGFDDFDLFNRLAITGHGVMKDPGIAIIHQWHEKNYPYNIYDHAEKNGKISEDMVKKGEYEANRGKAWGE